MARELAIDEDFDPGLYDSDTRESLVTERVVDVTEDVIGGERTILLYTKAQRGRIVQISHPYAGEKYSGAHVHFFMDELSLRADAAFSYCAMRAGMSRRQFLRLIFQHAPAAEAADG